MTRTNTIAVFSTRFVRLCMALLLSTLALVTLGGIVRVTGSGLGCPDWPLCHGRLIPPWQLAPWIEYTHRLAATAVTVQVIAFVAVAWRRYRAETWVIWPASISPILIAAQILLGRLIVVHEIPPATAWVHTAIAMAILACTAVPVCATYAPLRSLALRTAGYIAGTPHGQRLPVLVALAALAVYVLLMTGAYVTRSGASTACRAFPACGSAASDEAARRLTGIHMLHRLAAAGAAAVLGLALAALWRAGVGDRALRGGVLATAGLFLAQVGLGISNVLLELPFWSRALHLTVAAALWMMVTILAITIWRAWLASLPRQGGPLREQFPVPPPLEQPTN